MVPRNVIDAKYNENDFNKTTNHLDIFSKKTSQKNPKDSSSYSWTTFQIKNKPVGIY